MNKLLQAMLAVSLIAVVSSDAKEGVRLNVSEGDKSELFTRTLKQELGATGFVLSDPHERINDAYKEKYGVPMIQGKPNDAYDPDFKVTLDNLGFFPVSSDAALRELLLEEPKLGAFSPLNLLIYKTTGESKTYVGHLAPEAILDIVGVEDTAVRSAYIKSFEPLDALLDAKFGSTVRHITYTQTAKEPMMEFVLKFDRSESLDDFVDAFQEEFEAAFEENQYIIAGYKNFKEVYGESGKDFDRYDRYWVYTICHFAFSYNIFNKGNPEAGVFAPCAMYMYIEKGGNQLHIGMPTLENWKTVMGLGDAEQLHGFQDIDHEIVDIMTKTLGATKK